jgi:hypothetical protein
MDRGKVEIIQVIRTSLTTRGTGRLGDGLRTIVQYWRLLDSGLACELLWEDDPQLTGRGPVVYLEPAAEPEHELGGMD